MTHIDPEQERQRLAAFYARQMDGELEKVASEAYDLTDLAREALRDELDKRGLAVKLVEQPPVTEKPPQEETLSQLGAPPAPPEPAEEDPLAAGGELEFRNTVAIRQFRDLPEALVAKGSLDSAGIKSALVDANMVRLDWFWSNLMGGVKLVVDREDAAAAEELLSQPIPEHFEVSGVGEYEQPRCPRCGSLDVNFQEIAPAAYLTAAVIGVPLPFHRRAWRCRGCNAEWEDDGAQSPANPSA